MTSTDATPRIEIAADGPVHVVGDVRLVRRREVRDDTGAAVDWHDVQELATGGDAWLCRCGESSDKPFCDGSHKRNFGADDTCPPAYAESAKSLGGVGLTISDDRSLCVHAKFCFSKTANVWKQAKDTADEAVATQLVSMIQRCPSGALTVRYSDDDVDYEDQTSQTVAVIDNGPLWVIGGIPIMLADGTQLEPRNRVTLCRCGQSATKPLCDGTHHKVEFFDEAPEVDATE